MISHTIRRTSRTSSPTCNQVYWTPAGSIRRVWTGYIGLRNEDDQRWQKFLDRWSEWNILLGHNERRMREALAKDGLEVPSTVSFSPN